MPTDEQADLARAVRSVLARESGERLWPVLCEQVGVAALAIPEAFGGAGAGIRELQIVAEELGRELTPSPLLGSAALATHTLLAARDEDACKRLLSPLAEGHALATLAWACQDGRWDPASCAFTATPAGSGEYTVDGTAHYVLDGDIADTVLVAAQCGDELGLFEIADGVHAEHRATMDRTRRMAVVTVTGARTVRIGTGDFRAGLARARDVACAVLAAEQVGAAASALEQTVAYSKQRVQFGRPIGGFQALKHRMADLHVLVESARSACYAAGEALDTALDAESGQAAARAALTAKVYCSEAFSAVAAEMIQLHGGIAITWEHDAHRYFKRAHSSSQLFGQPHEHRARLAAGLLD
ncbi:MAG: acyl-CoA dehydrogenase [Actinophytocola sp.]|nr:acyl-CoA dehydrogenase [Actinophytocola sp.]